MKRLLLTIITFSLFASSLAAQKVTENDSTVVVTSQTTETKHDNYFKYTDYPILCKIFCIG